MWVEGGKPESVNAAENETAVFYCLADAIPAPDYFWFLNGVPISSNVPLTTNSKKYFS